MLKIFLIMLVALIPFGATGRGMVASALNHLVE